MSPSLGSALELNTRPSSLFSLPKTSLSYRTALSSPDRHSKTMLSRGEFPGLDEEKAIGQYGHDPKHSVSTFLSTSDDSFTDLELSDTDQHESSVQSSWQGFDKPATPPLASKSGSRWYRGFRWTVFSVYRRLFAFCFVANAAALIAVGATGSLTSQNAATAAAVNLLVAILARQEHVVNALFVATSAVPVTWPLWFRRRIAKIYCYGGWHSGCSIAAFVWYAVFVGFATRDFSSGNSLLLPAVVLGYVLVAIFVLIIIFAHPNLRMRFHNYFEITHRFAGYAAIGIFWAQVVLLAHASRGLEHSIGHEMVHTPAFWCLILITMMIVYPWLRLRKRLVRFEYLSTHAVRLHFTHTSLDYCVGVRLTTNPLFETHAFATIPNKSGDDNGFSVIISNAGDWTSRLISSAKPPDEETSVASGHAPVAVSTVRPGPSLPPQQTNASFGRFPNRKLFERYIYTKGAPIYGVLRVATIFRKPVIVTTGSGIGPCMSLLNGRPYHGSEWKCRVLWATKSPVKTYGEEIVADVRRADPRAEIVDTGVSGRPDMVELTWKMFQDKTTQRASWRSGTSQQSQLPQEAPEAVIVISNPKVTRKIVYGMEARGVPAYGVIFDS